jgi:cell division septation protein DedD
VSEAPLDPVVETADAAIEATPVVAPEKPAASVTKAPASTSSLSKPYIQIGIFSVEQNAKNTAQSMRQRGIIPLIKEMTLNGKTFWRVIVGPAQSASDLKSLKDKVQKAGFSDAYAVSG